MAKTHKHDTFKFVQLNNSVSLTILMACNMLAGQIVRKSAYDLRRFERERQLDKGPLSGTPSMSVDKAPADEFPRQDGFALDGVDTTANRAAEEAVARTELNAGYKLLIASAEAIARLAMHTEADNYSRQVAPYAWVLRPRDDGSKRFYTGIVDVLRDNEAWSASRATMERAAAIAAFDDILTEQEREAARVNTRMGARALAAERRHELEVTVGSHLTSRYDPRSKETAQLFAEIKRHIRELGADPDLVAASAIWRAAQTMKKAAIGAINPRTQMPYQMQLDAEIISLAVQLKREGYAPDSEQNRDKVLADLDEL